MTANSPICIHSPYRSRSKDRNKRKERWAGVDNVKDVPETVSNEFDIPLETYTETDNTNSKTLQC